MKDSFVIDIERLECDGCRCIRNINLIKERYNNPLVQISISDKRKLKQYNEELKQINDKLYELTTYRLGDKLTLSKVVEIVLYLKHTGHFKEY